MSGIVDCLENSSDQLCLLSHRSGQPETARTQDQLVRVLHRRYPNRIRHYKFYCSLRQIRAKEETQRTRSFLYTAIAYALTHALSQKEIFVYENGITSINFPKRQDLMNARASRTTHPKTIACLENFFATIYEPKVKIVTPFLWKTKTEIYQVLSEAGREDLITSAVSCSQTLQHTGQATHCGGCSQCIDRRFAAYGSELDDVDDSGIYTLDFIKEDVGRDEVRTTLIDYVRQARHFASLNYDNFYYKMLNELVDLIDYIPGTSEQEKVEKVWKVCHRHGKQVEAAIRRMKTIHDDPFLPLPEGSFLQMIAEREYLHDPTQEQRDQTTNSKSRSKSIEVFCAYSHKDEDLLEQLENHLSSLKRREVIAVWHDQRIGAGGEWEEEIHEHLNTAHIILLLISSDFLASNYCYNIEMRRAMERHEAKEAHVIPIILRPVDWEDEPLSKLSGVA